MQWSSLQCGSRHGYMHLCVWGQSVFQRVESTACETEQQSTLTEKLPFCYPSLHPPALHSPLASHFFLLPPLSSVFSLFLSLSLPPLVFLSGLRGMLSGPITQEAGIAEMSARKEAREQEGWGSGETGKWRQLQGEETGWKLRCMKIRWKSSKLNMRTHLEIDGCPAS